MKKAEIRGLTFIDSHCFFTVGITPGRLGTRPGSSKGSFWLLSILNLYTSPVDGDASKEGTARELGVAGSTTGAFGEAGLTAGAFGEGCLFDGVLSVLVGNPVSKSPSPSPSLSPKTDPPSL